MEYKTEDFLITQINNEIIDIRLTGNESQGTWDKLDKEDLENLINRYIMGNSQPWMTV